MRGKLDQDLKEFHDGEKQRDSLYRLTLERERLHQDNKTLERENKDLRDRLSILERVGEHVVGTPPTWTVKLPGKGKLHHGMPTLLLSDCHFDEVVRSEEVENVNKFDRRIAVQRLKRTRERAELLLQQYVQGIKYDGIVVLLGGDMLSGAIHEELIETNADTLFGSVDFWADELAGFINSLRDTYGNVHCVGVVGNHGRRTRKPVAKRRVKDNIDWLLYRMIARSTPNVTWRIPDSTDIDVPIYKTVFRLTHGDQFKGGSGIAGMLSPIMLGQHRKAQQQMALGRTPFDWLVLGHWHQYFLGRGVIVNGALKGFDEFAYVSNFRYEPAQQAFWITTPEHGVAFAAPIFCSDRKAEGW